MVPDKWKLAYFQSSVFYFHNSFEREDCEHFADQFFDKVEYVEENFHRVYFGAWFT